MNILFIILGTILFVLSFCFNRAFFPQYLEVVFQNNASDVDNNSERNKLQISSEEDYNLHVDSNGNHKYDKYPDQSKFFSEKESGINISETNYSMYHIPPVYSSAIPSYIDMILTLFIIPLVTIPIPLNLLNFFNKYYYNYAIFYYNGSTTSTGNTSPQKVKQLPGPKTQSHTPSSGIHIIEESRKTFGFGSPSDDKKVAKSPISNTGFAGAKRNSDPSDNIVERKISAVNSQNTQIIIGETIDVLDDYKQSPSSPIKPRNDSSNLGDLLSKDSLYDLGKAQRSESMQVEFNNHKDSDAQSNYTLGDVDALVNGPVEFAFSDNPSTREESQMDTPMTNSGMFQKPNQNKQVLENNEKYYERLRFLKFTTSKTFQRGFIFLYMLPFVIISIICLTTIDDYYPERRCFLKKHHPLVNYTIIGTGIAAVFLSLIGAYAVRNLPDPFGIVKECKYYSLVGGLIALVGYILFSEVPVSNPYFSYNYITVFGLNIMVFISTSLQVYFAMKTTHGFSRKERQKYVRRMNYSKRATSFRLRSEHYRQDESSHLEHRSKNNLSSSTFGQNEASKDDDKSRTSSPQRGRSNKQSRDDIYATLADPVLTKAFGDHLVGEFSSEMLRMYLECRQWEKSFPNTSDIVRRARAKRIVDYFVKQDSLFEVNIPYSVREDILAKVKSSAPLTITLFQESQKEMVDMMEGAFLRFCKTKQFLNITKMRLSSPMAPNQISGNDIILALPKSSSKQKLTRADSQSSDYNTQNMFIPNPNTPIRERTETLDLDGQIQLI